MHVEISVRDLSLLENTILKIKEVKPEHINLTDKTGFPNNLIAASKIFEQVSQITITPHYALKNHTSKDPELIIENFRSYLTETQDLGIEQILLVSGHPRPKFDTLAALNFVRQYREEFADITFAIGFNPFLPSERLEEEKIRLQQKIDSGLISEIYLQVGSLTKPLKSAIENLRETYPQLKISSSIVIPDENFLRKFRFRPWKDVYLDEKYLANLKNATQKTQDLMGILTSYQIEPLITVTDFTKFNSESFVEVYGQFLSQ